MFIKVLINNIKREIGVKSFIKLSVPITHTHTHARIDTVDNIIKSFKYIANCNEFFIQMISCFFFFLAIIGEVEST